MQPQVPATLPGIFDVKYFILQVHFILIHQMKWIA